MYSLIDFISSMFYFILYIEHIVAEREVRNVFQQYIV